MKGVTDGDTITLLTEDNQQVKIRLDGIDAPESGQAFGQQSKAMLSEKVFSKSVLAINRGLDRYGRTLAIVKVDGRIINKEMVAEGWAWHYKKYSDSPALATAEQNAKTKKLGLWADSHSIPPWNFRDTPRRTPKKVSVGKPTVESPPNNSGYWITSSSGVRHNSSCRYYHNSKGYEGSSTDGRACKICGG